MTPSPRNNSALWRRRVERLYRRGTPVVVILGVIAVIAFNVASPHPVVRYPPSASPFPGLIRDLDASDLHAFKREFSDDDGSRRAWSDCSAVSSSGHKIRFDDTHTSDHEYIATLTGASQDAPPKIRTCTVWVYWDYETGWQADAVPFALTIPTSFAALPLAHSHTDHYEDSLITEIISTYDRNARIENLNLFSHDDYSSYAWNACSIISPKNRTIDMVGSNGGDEIFVTLTGMNKKHPSQPQACTFWLRDDREVNAGWEVDGVDGALTSSSAS
jgi:hypothetical protein